MRTIAIISTAVLLAVGALGFLAPATAVDPARLDQCVCPRCSYWHHVHHKWVDSPSQDWLSTTTDCEGHYKPCPRCGTWHCCEPVLKEPSKPEPERIPPDVPPWREPDRFPDCFGSDGGGHGGEAMLCAAPPVDKLDRYRDRPCRACIERPKPYKYKTNN